MTDKQIIECKYKFQSIEKFAGKPYCTLHNETCEFINFVCDKNCQVYEDYKQLKAKEQECERLKEEIKTKTGKDYINEIQDITMKYECHQKSLGRCWWGKYGKETECIGIRECHKRELEVIQKLEFDLKHKKEKVNELEQQLDQLKGVIKKYEECNKYLVEENGKTYTRLEYKLLKTLAEIKKLVEKEFCRHPECCEFCAISNECVNQKIIEKINEVKNES